MAGGNPASRARSSRLIVLALLPLALFALSAWLLARGALPWEASWPWVPSLGIDFALRIDGLSLLFLLLISGVGALVFVYAAGYMAGDPRRVRLFILLSLFMLAMVGAVTTDSLLVLFVFWEATSVTSFLLVGYKHEHEDTRRSAQQALMVTAAGGLALLAGIILLSTMTGSWSIQEVIRQAPRLAADPRLPAALICIIVGAFTKSAQFPFHFWLPDAMAAPTPVSAYLHSATMVKLGVYLLARLEPAFGASSLWEVTLVSAGAFTAAWAMLLAMRERDLKRIFAWSTVSSLGLLFVLIGLPGPGSASATAAFLLAHALYKAPLFFVAGNVDHCTGTRSIDHLSGMARRMPWTAAAALLAGMSMAGMPLSFGFFAKDLVNIAKTEGAVFEWVSYATVFVSAASVAVGAVAAIRVFWHRGGATLPDEIHEASAAMIGPPLAIAGIGALFGLAPSLVEPLIAAAAVAMQPDLVPEAALLVDESSALGTAVTALVLGALVFLAWDRIHRLLERARWADAFGMAAWYGRALKAVPAGAAWLTPRLQHGRLPAYVAVLIAFIVAAVAAAWGAGGAVRWPAWTPPGAAVSAAAAVVVAAVVAASVVGDAFVMLLAGGLAGFGSAALFLFLGAPDLALTQFTVEVVFVVVAAAVILRVRRLDLPRAAEIRQFPRASLALAAGALVAVALLTVGAGPLDQALPRYFGDRSVAEAFGRNVVNVVIVDFRALDTLGEIAVVAVTLVAALPLLALLREHGGESGAERVVARAVLLDVAVRWLYPAIMLASIWILLRGHNEPGGGFTGGMVAVAATAMLAVASGSERALGRLPMGAMGLAAAGVALSLASGLPALALGQPYLSHLWFTLPLAGTKVSTVLAFDLGVYLAVWGALGGIAARAIGIDEEGVR